MAPRSSSPDLLAQNPPPSALAEGPGAAAGPALSLPRVLVVDVEEANLDIFRRVFRREFQCELATSGRSALALLEREHFDCAVVDFRMRSMNGLELLAVIARRWPDTLRMMVTGNAELPELRAARTTRLAEALIQKPWTRDQILDGYRRARPPELQPTER